MLPAFYEDPAPSVLCHVIDAPSLQGLPEKLLLFPESMI